MNLTTLKNMPVPELLNHVDRDDPVINLLCEHLEDYECSHCEEHIERIETLEEKEKISAIKLAEALDEILVFTSE